MTVAAQGVQGLVATQAQQQGRDTGAVGFEHAGLLHDRTPAAGAAPPEPAPRPAPPVLPISFFIKQEAARAAVHVSGFCLEIPPRGGT